MSAAARRPKLRWLSPLIDWRLLAPAMACMLLIQMLVPTARVATTYLALDRQVSTFGIGIISSGFALLPVLATMQIGRLARRDFGRPALLSGILLVVGALASLALLPATLVRLAVLTAVLGVGQTLAMTALQTIAVSATGRYNRDAVIGNALMANAIGHAVGPLLITLASRTSMQIGTAILVICALGGSVPLLAATAMVVRAGRRRRGASLQSAGQGASDPVALRNTVGLRPLLLIGALSATAIDLLVVFLPVMATERALSPQTVGWMLTVRAIASIVVRLVFARLARRFGRPALMMLSIGLTVAGLLGLVVPSAPAVTFAAVVLCGLGLGIVATSSLSMTLGLVAPALHPAAISARLGANRLLQFLLPVGAGVLAANLGVGAVFAALAACLVGNAALLPRR